MISPKDDMIASLILSYHERWDGSGYPNGLSGCNIPYLSRVIAVADSIDAMMSDRCYRKALSWNQCLDELDRNRSKMYDPEIVDAAFVCQSMIFNALRAD